MKEIIRVKEIQLINIKNINQGTLKFPQYDPDLEASSNIIGLYGQNGSGKTAVVEAFRVVQQLLGGRQYQRFTNLLQCSKLFYEIKVVFSIHLETKENLEVTYDMKYSKLNDFTETLAYKNIDTGIKSTVTISDELLRDHKIMKPEQRLKDFGINNKDSEVIYLAERKVISESRHTSFLFSNEFRNTLITNLKDDYFRKVIKLLSHYAKRYMFIIENTRNANVNSNIILPITMSMKNSAGEDQYADQRIFYAESSLPENQLGMLEKNISEISKVINTFIPDLKIYVNRTHKNGVDPFGHPVTSFQLFSNRNGHKFPLQFESDGIKKLISFVACLIFMYNNENVLIIIDELDSGIFEYLIGEVLQVLEEGGQGQLLFTSHNLRPLEILDSKEIWFATTNPDERYRQFTGIKPNNNLRDVYLRLIKLGGESEDIYKPTDQYKIRDAFIQAKNENDGKKH